MYMVSGFEIFNSLGLISYFPSIPIYCRLTEGNHFKGVPE